MAMDTETRRTQALDQAMRLINEAGFFDGEEQRLADVLTAVRASIRGTSSIAKATKGHVYDAIEDLMGHIEMERPEIEECRRAELMEG